jgi:hypothetical protein
MMNSSDQYLNLSGNDLIMEAAISKILCAI